MYDAFTGPTLADTPRICTGIIDRSGLGQCAHCSQSSASSQTPAQLCTLRADVWARPVDARRGTDAQEIAAQGDSRVHVVKVHVVFRWRTEIHADADLEIENANAGTSAPGKADSDRLAQATQRV